MRCPNYANQTAYIAGQWLWSVYLVGCAYSKSTRQRTGILVHNNRRIRVRRDTDGIWVAA